MSETKPTFVSVLQDALGERIDPSAANFIEMMSEDFVMEFPYARPGMQRRIEGRQAVVAYLMGVAGSVSVDTVGNVVVHQTGDPEVVIVEFEARGRALKVDEPYEQRYISVIRARGGRMIHYKDYWDPLQGLKAQVGAAAVEAFVLGDAA
ncbi:nuclear transport factor 2 family protein [Phenylobacterium sp.]|uniref:nuclear transport factor 2 family protein n=1 Tax=Phenylobacterium sp. TaxID=1871053 RepID=UPI0025DE4D74|nr:nuclear transport factor 2 family protein [Phenylobacterium sp.]